MANPAERILYFDTGLDLKLLQEYYLVALDIFRKFHYDKEETNELKGWLSFLCTSSVSEAEKLTEQYPWLEDIYREAAAMSYNLEEVMSVWSEALQILDRNGMQLMIDELNTNNSELSSRNSELSSQISELSSQISNLTSQIAILKDQSDTERAKITELEAENKLLRAAREQEK